MHHARWMAKAIFSFKIFLFRGEFRLTAGNEKSTRNLYFIVLFYIKAWFTSTSAIFASNQDLELLQKLILYKKRNSFVSLAATRKLYDHLWYLSEELATLALFDENVPIQIK